MARTKKVEEELKTIEPSIKSIKISPPEKNMAYAMDMGEIPEEKFARMIEIISTGRQSKDIIKTVLLTKSMETDDSTIKGYLTSYNNNIGGFLEELSIIPVNTGIIFNELQKGKTPKDAIFSFAKSRALEDEEIKNILNAVSEKGIFGAIEYIDGNIPTETKLTASIATDTALKVGEYTSIGAITFSGTVLEDDPVTIKITPKNCKFKGLTSNASTEHSSTYTLESQTTLENINNEFTSVQVQPTATNNVQLVVQIDSETEKPFTFSNVTEDSKVTVSLDTSTQLTQNSYVAINPILFSGKVVESDPVTVKVTPENCSFKGLVSDSGTEHDSEYTFSNKTTLEEINAEFASLQVKATNTTGVKLTVSIDDSPNEFTFSNVTAAGAG